jgi:hypothetical protein
MALITGSRRQIDDSDVMAGSRNLARLNARLSRAAGGPAGFIELEPFALSRMRYHLSFALSREKIAADRLNINLTSPSAVASFVYPRSCAP